MPDMELLKYARTRDAVGFVHRVSGAMMKLALYRLDTNADVSVESKALMNWVLDNPLQPVDLMVAFAATMPEINAQVTIIDDAVSTDGVSDQHISYIVDAKWNTVADRMFGAAA